MKWTKTLPTIFAALLVALVACVPIQDFATGTLNDQLGDSASLTFVTTAPGGLLFDPGDAATTDTIIDVLYDSLTAIDDERCEPSGNGHVCNLGTVTEPTFVRVGGTNVTAQVSYRRGAGRLYTEFAVH